MEVTWEVASGEKAHGLVLGKLLSLHNFVAHDTNRISALHVLFHLASDDRASAQQQMAA